MAAPRRVSGINASCPLRLSPQQRRDDLLEAFSGPGGIAVIPAVVGQQPVPVDREVDREAPDAAVAARVGAAQQSHRKAGFWPINLPLLHVSRVCSAFMTDSYGTHPCAAPRCTDEALAMRRFHVLARVAAIVLYAWWHPARFLRGPKEMMTSRHANQGSVAKWVFSNVFIRSL
jgi:hypothetical protein